MSSNYMMRDVQNTHAELVNQVYNINVQWTEGQTLFADDEVVELLNMTASSFFARYQRLFLDDIVSGISRLADPSEDRNYKNLSMLRLRDCVHAAKVPMLINNFDTAFASFEIKVNPLVKYRNKKLAHTDLDTLRQVAKLPRIEIGHIRAAISALNKTMNVVQEYIDQSFTDYEHTAPGHGAADALVYCLRKGLNAIEDEQTKIRKDLLIDSDN